MNWTEYKEQLTRNAKEISSKEKLRFAIEICDRLLPDYQSFVEKYKWGSIKTLEDGLTFCKDFSNEAEPEMVLIEKLIDGIEKNTPDTEDFGQIAGSLALNSACAVTETLKFIRDGKNERIVDIGTFSYDSEFFKVSDIKPGLTDSELENETELQNEMEWQLKRIKNVA